MRLPLLPRPSRRWLLAGLAGVAAHRARRRRGAGQPRSPSREAQGRSAHHGGRRRQARAGDRGHALLLQRAGLRGVRDGDATSPACSRRKASRSSAAWPACRSAWTARWGSGKPVITLGSDVDGIPQASQKPGVAYRDPLIEGGPGHGEGHNSGQAVNIAAAIVVKELMEREKIPGTLVLWPGVAEEQMAGKAFFVREGVFKDADVALFTHVGNDLGVSWGASGRRRRSSRPSSSSRAPVRTPPARPWRGKSALDAVDAHGAAAGSTSASTCASRSARTTSIARRRRPAQRGAEHGQHLVLLPRAGLPAHDGAVRDRASASRRARR